MPTIAEKLAVYRAAGKTRLEKLTTEEKNVFDRAVLPVKGAWLSQGVGEGHVALDFAAAFGTPVVSPVKGVVTSIQDLATGYGRNIRVTTPLGEELIFGHLGDVLVKLGQKVFSGVQLGTIGMTGSTTGPHLHFERRVQGEAVDPWQLLKGAGQPIIDAMQYGVTSKQQKAKPVVVSSQTERSVPASINLDNLSATMPTGVAGAAVTVALSKGVTPVLSDRIVDTLTSPFERAAVGAIGVILVVVGLFILSSGLREQTMKFGKEATKVMAGAIAGGPAGAAAGAAL